VVSKLQRIGILIHIYVSVVRKSSRRGVQYSWSNNRISKYYFNVWHLDAGAVKLTESPPTSGAS
jgi:hypothetical protein